MTTVYWKERRRAKALRRRREKQQIKEELTAITRRNYDTEKTRTEIRSK